MKTKSTFLRHFVINKILMAIVPVLLLVVLTVERYYSFDTQRIRETQTQTLYGNIQTFEARYEDLLAVTTRLGNQPAPIEANHAPTQISYALLDLLRDSMLPRTFYTEFLYLPAENQFIYTSSYTTYSKESFLSGQSSMQFSVTSPEDVFATAEKGEPAILPAQGVKISGRTFDAVAILLPVKHYGTLIALLDCDMLSASFGGSDGDSYGIVVYSDGVPIYSDYADRPAPEFFSLSSDEIAVERRGDEFFFAIQSHFAGLQIVRSVHASSWQDVKVNYILLTAIFAICVLWIVLFLWISVKKEYRPILNISNNLRRLMTEGQPTSPETDEIAVLLHAVDFVRALKARNEPSQSVEEVRLDDWIDAQIAEFKESAPFAMYAVFLVSADPIRTLTEQPVWKDAIEWGEARFTCAEGYAAVAVGYRENRELNRLLGEAAACLESACGADKYRIAVGSVVESVNKLQRSLFDARLVINYMVCKGLHGTYSSSEFVSDPMSQNKQLIRLMMNFNNALRLKDAEKLDATLKEIEVFIGDFDTSLDNSKTVFYFVRSSFLDLLQDTAEFSGDGRVKELIGTEINDVNVMIMMLKVMEDYFHTFCIASSEARGGIDREEVEAYIAEHYLGPDFSLHNLALHYQMSPSVFSKAFKTMFGVNFKAYVDARKMTEAGRLLRESNMTVEKIAERLNYSNASNFLRAFKSYYLMSPGQYRKNNGEGDEGRS